MQQRGQRVRPGLGARDVQPHARAPDHRHGPQAELPQVPDMAGTQQRARKRRVRHVVARWNHALPLCDRDPGRPARFQRRARQYGVGLGGMGSPATTATRRTGTGLSSLAPSVSAARTAIPSRAATGCGGIPGEGTSCARMRPAACARSPIPTAQRSAGRQPGQRVGKRDHAVHYALALRRESTHASCIAVKKSSEDAMAHRSGRHFLQIPGPTNVPDRILRAIDMPTMDHRGPEFGALGRRVLAGLREVFGTAGSVIVFPSSGTGAWEAAIVNTLRPGDRVLMYETGQFATLWRAMAARLGLAVEFVPGDWRHGARSCRCRAAAACR